MPSGEALVTFRSLSDGDVEAEHAMTLTRRVYELSFEVQDRPVADDQYRASTATSTKSDHDKMVALGCAQPWDPPRPDIFGATFTDHTIDPTTGALFGCYIAEERG